MTKTFALSCLFVMANLCGCANTLYFYETDKISVSIEARPDSTQPIQGSVGLKQRVAVIAPSMKDPANEQAAEPDILDKVKSDTVIATDDAVSLLTSFRFRMEPGSGLFQKKPITIQTALITGDAAKSVNTGEKAAEIAKAIIANPIPGWDQLANSSIAKAKADPATYPQFLQLTAKKWQDLRSAEKTTLGNLTGTLDLYSMDDYGKPLHQAIQMQLGFSP